MHSFVVGVMKDPIRRKPQFVVNDRVRVVGPSAAQRPDIEGTVTEIVGWAGNVVPRYRITFSDGSSETFFGFELEFIE